MKLESPGPPLTLHSCLWMNEIESAMTPAFGKDLILCTQKFLALLESILITHVSYTSKDQHFVYR